jgi:hypothetical protein
LLNLCRVFVRLIFWSGEEQTQVLEFDWTLARFCCCWTLRFSQQTENIECERGGGIQVATGGDCGKAGRAAGQSEMESLWSFSYLKCSYCK